MHPFYELSRDLVHIFAPKRISLFYANDILAICLVPEMDIAVNGTTFRKVFRQAGLHQDWFSQQASQKLTLMWAGTQGEYRASADDPTALDNTIRAERISKTAAPQKLISILIEGIKVDPPKEVEMWPYLLGIPMYWNATQYERNDDKFAGLTITWGKSIVRVVVRSSIEEVTLLHKGKLITSTSVPIKLPILILIDGEKHASIEDVLGFVQRALRSEIDKLLEPTPYSLEDGLPIEKLAEIIKEPLLKKLLASDKQGVALSIFATLTGLGVRWKPQWGLDELGGLRYWTEPEKIICDPIQMTIPSSIISAVLPLSLPIVPQHGAPFNLEPVMPEITIDGEYPGEDRLGYNAVAIRVRNHDLPFLISFGEGSAIVNGNEETLAPGLYLVRGKEDFSTFWKNLISNKNLLRLFLTCLQEIIGHISFDALEWAVWSDTDPEIDVELVASFILKNEVHLSDWRERKLAGLLHKTAQQHSMRLHHELLTLVGRMHTPSVQDKVREAVELSQQARKQAFSNILAEAAAPEPQHSADSVVEVAAS